jgi:hypothetical protein
MYKECKVYMIETCRYLLPYLKHTGLYELMSCTYPKFRSAHFELGLRVKR